VAGTRSPAVIALRGCERAREKSYVGSDAHATDGSGRPRAGRAAPWSIPVESETAVRFASLPVSLPVWRLCVDRGSIGWSNRAAGLWTGSDRVYPRPFRPRAPGADSERRIVRMAKDDADGLVPFQDVRVLRIGDKSVWLPRLHISGKLWCTGDRSKLFIRRNPPRDVGARRIRSGTKARLSHLRRLPRRWMASFRLRLDELTIGPQKAPHDSEGGGDGIADTPGRTTMARHSTSGAHGEQTRRQPVTAASIARPYWTRTR